ncbi:MAG: capsular biosynthesis protein [Sphingomonadaceae bacterium]|nr:capsular biosynthesis protein [Sphingomonadaceae bacterium]
MASTPNRPRLVRTSGAESAKRAAGAPLLPDIPRDAPYCFRGRNILMLQGPVGPFFNGLAQDVRWAGANVHKINFNGGDWFFFPRGATSFTGKASAFPPFLERFCDEKRIDTVMLFGDCRKLHDIAARVAKARGIELLVFEEGYIRPDYITMERHGVNGRSAMPRSPIFYLNTPSPEPRPPQRIRQTIWRATALAFTYYFWAVLLSPFFPRYKHHRPLSWFEGLMWTRGAFRKLWYQLANRRIVARLNGDERPPFFLVPLQVHNDAQVDVHSTFDSVEAFIEHVVASFAASAPGDRLLVFKHHPMDRAYTDYTRLLRRLARSSGLGERLIYVHDPHLPTLLSHAEGVVTINSTTGFSAIHHGTPTLLLGEAVYRIDGLVAATSLDRFWSTAADHPVHRELYLSFRRQLIERTQINGNFYRRLPIPGSMSGIDWARGKEPRTEQGADAEAATREG